MSARDRALDAATTALVALAIVLFLPTLSAPWEYDDKIEILGNRVLREPSDFGAMFGYNPFRVVLMYTFAFDLWAWGSTPWPYRIENIAIHVANTLLVASCLRHFGASLPTPATRRLFALAGTAFFALHPLAIEAVTYVSGRSTSLATCFVLIAFRAWLASRTAVDARARAAAEWTAAIAYLLGCFTKEIAVPAPLLLPLGEAALSGTVPRTTPRFGPRLLPFLLAPLAMLALRGGAYGYVASPSFIRPWLDNLTTQAQVVAHYLRLAVLPFPQSVYHDHPVVAPTSILSWCLLVAYAVLLALALRVLRRAPPLGFGVLGYALFLAPTSSFFPLKETMVEHRTYLPHAFAALAVGWTGAVALTALAARLGRRTPWLHGAIPCALHAVLLCALHVQYGALWQHEETLWVNAVARNGDAVDAHRYLGDLQLEQGRLDDAAASFRRAIAIRPRDGELLSKLGSVLARKGELVEAERLFASALAVSPCHAPALNNLARSLRLRGDTQGAMRRYEEAIRCDADNWLAEKGLGDLYDARGDDRAAAARHYTRALELMDPYHPDAALLKRRIRELTF